MRQLQPSRWFGSHRVRVISAASLVGLVLGLTIWLIGYDPLDADIKYDWLVAREAVRTEGDAYRNLLLIAEDEGVDIVVNTGSRAKELSGHPRLPGALLVQLPLIVIPYGALYPVSMVLSVVAVGVLVASIEPKGLARFGLVVLGVAFITAPLYVNLRYASQAALIACLTLWGWRLTQTNREYSGGILVGIAAVLKVYPAILIMAMILAKRWRGSAALVATGVIVNVAGLALPGVSVSRALEELPSASGTWASLVLNGSLVGPLTESGMSTLDAQILAIVLATTLVLVVSAMRGGLPGALIASPFPLLAAGLLMIPLSWVSYDLVLLPAVALIAGSNIRSLHMSGLLTFGLWIALAGLIVMRIIPSGAMVMLARILILISTVIGAGHLADWRLPVPRRLSALQEKSPVADHS